MKRLVIIDDDPIDHFVMKHSLRGNSYFDTTTYTIYGSLVLDYIEENKSKPEKLPDAIILDLNMPAFSGWDFLDRLRDMSCDIDKNIQVHVLTSSIRPVDEEQANKYPFVKSFISKPFQPSMLNLITDNQYIV
jgi:CheY-like chemotaxis protein